MRVLIWTQYFWPENFHINAIAAEMAKLGVKVTVLTGKPNYPEGRVFDGYREFGIGREAYAGCEVIRIPLRVRGAGSAKRLAMNYLSFVLMGYAVAPFVLRNKTFDVVFVYAPSPILQALPAILVAWFKRIKLTLWVQDLWPDALVSTGFVKNNVVLKFVEFVVRYVYHFSDRVLIQSEQFRKPIEELACDPAKIVFFPNSAEDMLDNASPRSGFSNSESLGINKYFSVVFAGNIGGAQSCETIVGAAELLKDFPEIRFFLVGSGSASSSIAFDIERRGLSNIVMTGRFPPEDMPGIYASASALLLSLRSDPALSATVPSKLQSYMSAGKPIVASLDGEAARLVERAVAGVTCPAGDSEALARAVRALFEMLPAERDKLGMNALVFFKENFDIKKRVRELIDILRSDFPKERMV